MPTRSGLDLTALERLRFEHAPLLHWRRGQLHPEAAYVELDRHGRLFADWWPREAGVPADVWFCATIRWPVSPLLSGERLYQVVRELLPLFERVHRGRHVVWDGQHRQGYLNADAQEAAREINERLEAVEPDLVAMRVEDWLFGGGTALLFTWDGSEPLGEVVDRLTAEARREGLALVGDIEHTLLTEAARYVREEEPGLTWEAVATLLDRGFITEPEAENYRRAMASENVAMSQPQG